MFAIEFLTDTLKTRININFDFLEIQSTRHIERKMEKYQ